jgi:hypothetical protein
VRTESVEARHRAIEAAAEINARAVAARRMPRLG